MGHLRFVQGPAYGGRLIAPVRHERFEWLCDALAYSADGVDEGVYFAFGGEGA